MKKIVFTLICVHLCLASWAQGFYGNVIASENFDNSSSLSTWTEKNETPKGTQGDTTKWQIANPISGSFTTINPNNLFSGYVKVNQGEKPLLTLTKNINIKDKTDIAIGFYGKGLGGLGKGLFLNFLISKDNGLTWTTIFNSFDNASDGQRLSNSWFFYKYFLGDEYNELTSILVQFQVDGTKYSASGTDIYIDNFYVSERYEIDHVANELNYGNYNTGGYTTSENITLGIKNEGKNAITSVKLHYQIDTGNIVSEIFTPSSPIAKLDSTKYTFTQKANLSIPGKTFSIKAWIDSIEDGDTTNNSVEGSATNITVSTPYIPAFRVYDEDQQIWYLTDDMWKTKNYTSTGGSWRIGSSYDIATWSINHKDENTNANLISRPIYFEQGKTYEIKFDALTKFYSEENPDKNNILSLYVNDNANFDEKIKLYSNLSIDGKNAINSFVRYTATKSSPHYLFFHCTSPFSADPINVQNISILEAKSVDAGIVELLSPNNDQYEFTKSESVKVKVRNYGTNKILANTVSIHLRLNEQTIISEIINTDIEAGSNFIYSFTAKIDPSNQDINQILKIWMDLPKDENKANDSANFILQSIVAGIPYMPTEEKDFRSNWIRVDHNNDGYTFNLIDDHKLGKWAFSYGGATGNNGYVLQSSSESFFSRPVRLKKGNTYKLTNQVMVDKTAMPLRIEIYKIEGENKTLVKTIEPIQISNTSYQIMETLFDIQSDGIYKIAFVVEHKIPLEYKIYIGDFKLTKMADYDLTAFETTFSASKISCVNNPQIGIYIKNNGIQTITNFKIKAELSSVVLKEQQINAQLKAGENRLFFFDDRMVLNGSDTEDLKLSVILDKDENLYDNTITKTLTYIQPNDLSSQYTGILYSAMDIIILNHNKDAYGFNINLGGQRGMLYLGDSNTIANDELISGCISLQKDSLYSLNFRYQVEKLGDTAQLKVVLINSANSEEIEIADLKNIDKNKPLTFDGCFRPTSDGDYSIGFRVYGKTNSLRLINIFRVGKSKIAPDIEVLSFDEKLKDSMVFGQKQSIKVNFKNLGQFRLSSIPFELDVNGVKYFSTYNTVVSPNYETFITFENVNLFTPGEYTLTVKAKVSADLTIENNILSKKIVSLPVADLKVLSIDKPKSGSLSKTQQVMVTLKNNGKGDLSNIPIVFSIEGSNISLSEIIQGPIKNGESLQYTFQGSVNMFEEKTYHISVNAQVPNDTNEKDNTFSTSVICTQAPFDAGVTNILTPNDGVLSTKEVVSLTVKNFCTVDLFDIPVECNVGNQKIRGSIPQILSGQEMEYTFEETLDLSTYGTYTLKAHTLIPEDSSKSNDEFIKEVKSYKIDVGVVEIISPTSSINMEYEEVKILVKNFGEVTVNNIPVRYKVTSLAQMGMITNEIAPGQTTEFTFSSPYNFSAEKTYTIVAYTDYEKDMEPSNDSVRTKITNTIVTSISDPKNSLDISIYPNPVNNFLNIEGKYDYAEIYTSSGKLIFTFNSKKQIDLPNFAKGIYLLKIYKGAKFGIYKIVK